MALQDEITFGCFDFDAVDVGSLFGCFRWIEHPRVVVIDVLNSRVLAREPQRPGKGWAVGLAAGGGDNQ